jgi:hypothetical protein
MQAAHSIAPTAAAGVNVHFLRVVVFNVLIALLILVLSIIGALKKNHFDRARRSKITTQQIRMQKIPAGMQRHPAPRKRPYCPEPELALAPRACTFCSNAMNSACLFPPSPTPA